MDVHLHCFHLGTRGQLIVRGAHGSTMVAVAARRCLVEEEEARAVARHDGTTVPRRLAVPTAYVTDYLRKQV